MSKSETIYFFKFSQDDEDFSATKATPFTGNRGKKSLIKTEGSLFAILYTFLYQLLANTVCRGRTTRRFGRRKLFWQRVVRVGFSKEYQLGGNLC